jgi:hypothetical protein
MTDNQLERLTNLLDEIFEGDFCINHAESFGTIALLTKQKCYKEDIIPCGIPNDASLAIHLEVDEEGVIIP